MMRRSKKKRRLKRTPEREEMSLQITSMADIFTIILVFLLKSFSTGITNIGPSTIALPEAHASSDISDMLKVEISPNAILIEDKPVTTLQEFQFDTNDTESNGTPRSLNAALILHRQKEDKHLSTVGASPAGEEKERPQLMVMADRKTPYSTLKTVLTAASNNGFGDFKLVVVEDR